MEDKVKGSSGACPLSTIMVNTAGKQRQPFPPTLLCHLEGMARLRGPGGTVWKVCHSNGTPSLPIPQELYLPLVLSLPLAQLAGQSGMGGGSEMLLRLGMPYLARS